MMGSPKDIGARGARGERFVALDSLRGVAAVSVMLYHIGDFGVIGGLRVFQHAWLLVDFFFVLSGFVIAASYGDRLAAGFPRGPFMALRLGRVAPLHLATVALFALAEFLVFRPLLHEAHDTYYLWRGALLLDWTATSAGNFYAPVSWSISVEIVLYYAAAVLFASGRKGAAVALVIALAASLGLATGWNHVGLGMLLQRGIFGFAVGVACHILHRRMPTSLSPAALTFAELAAFSAVVWRLLDPAPRSASVISADVLFGIAVLAFARDGGALSRLLQTRPFAALGTRSYSIYMLHIAVIIALNRALPHAFAAIGREDLIAARPLRFGLLSVELGQVAETAVTLAVVTAVIALSALTFRWIEQPARQWSRERVRRARPTTDAFHQRAVPLSAAG